MPPTGDDNEGKVTVSLPWKIASVPIWFIIVAVVGGVGGDTLAYLKYGEVRRPNAFTLHDAEALEKRMARIENEHDALRAKIEGLATLVNSLDRKMDLLPPVEWRRRIENIEWWVHSQDADFRRKEK